MNAQELIHVHALLFELRVHFERDGDMPAGAFTAYETQPVRPTHIHRPKHEHEHAIDLLLEGLGQSVRTRPPPDHAPVS
ncbi:hypothetical protein E2L06_03455 [Haloterrigena sp. H1]|uniref:UPF0058 family protein n=1 Tax=Haloterrigena sp. H1 TaxID=2552943 RepID=UPI00110F240E|nr:UPF0058 family protein [Haloterrigena sp. H1]TMT85699.1 hypothetical protein E2L06_03455 [Haloterrigena sp. H1]